MMTSTRLLIHAKIAASGAGWVKARREQRVAQLGLNYPKMPHHRTYRRVFETMVDEETFEQLARQYQQRQGRQ
jgi:hypothetical protein